MYFPHVLSRVLSCINVLSRKTNNSKAESHIILRTDEKMHS